MNFWVLVIVLALMIPVLAVVLAWRAGSAPADARAADREEHRLDAGD